ncbi:hypothetical protein DICPUDRAFT_78747 [Dictyostelium purpureum]|uniref:Carbohydrate binding domain-containing protein n=1 Tax=Dictyostelium purpureum TaxID=5786 RepID=F0ZKF8_DICPU|nr:uncharacterized protein DICPUDRAFT_78747 [Dictyostelium purpureum]EGC35586.1 hypothetical protein DICPUDRAFT_78747 [Dictyostelium purpureum]|eukprot:XP_003287889.1 hypothetical protein DICPUDRAFT_78747 [Dictyostelium purpureum]
MKIITLIISFLFLINNVYSIDPTIVRFNSPNTDSYGSDSCTTVFNVLIQYKSSVPEDKFTYSSAGGFGYPSIINGSLYLFNVQHRVPVGQNQTVSFQLQDSSVSPKITWYFTDYATIDCDPIPTNLTIKAKQNTWVSNKGGLGTLFWLKWFEVSGLEKSAPYDVFTCNVPQPFYCVIQEHTNGPKDINFLFQIISLKMNAPFTPFDVVISDIYGRVLHTSVFDGLEGPTNPPISITGIEVYPKNGSTVHTDEMFKTTVYVMNILNYQGICSVDSLNDGFIKNSLIPFYGSPSNASYAGFTELLGNSPSISNLQITDSQGNKRASDYHYVYFTKNDNNGIIENGNSIQVEDTLINYSIININADASHATDSYFYSKMFEQNIPLKYPFGYSKGTIKYHTVSASFPVPRASSNLNGSISIVLSHNLVEESSVVLSDFIDTTNPQVLKVETVFLNFEQVITRIYAKDLESGIDHIELTFSKLTSSDLVYGDNFNGVYEIVETFYSYSGIKTPHITLYDGANNNVEFKSNQPIFDSELNKLPDYPLYTHIKETTGLEPLSFLAFEFIYNDIDVSNGPANNSLCFDFAGSNKTMIPRFTLYSHPLNYGFEEKAFIGSWNDAKEMFCLDFQIPARMFTGDALYSIYISPFYYESPHLIGNIGEKAQLRVRSSFADQMPPIITEFATYPSNNVEITENTNIGWNIRIEDSPNGFKSAEFNITSDFDLEPYTIRLTPTNATSGNENSGTYQLRIPIKANTCRSQSFRISSASITDTQGHTSLLPSVYFFNPLMKFLDSPHLTLNITCPQAIVDNTPPVLTSFSPSVNTIEVGVYKDFRNITFTFTTTDSGSGISTRHIPVIYLTAKGFNNPISKVSELASYSNGFATYTCTIQLPYGYGSYQGILVSVYGIVDNQLNINGYSTTDLQSLGFQSTIKVTYSNNPVLDTTSAINSTGASLTIYGHKFGIDSTKITLQVDYQNGQGWKNTPLSFFSGIILMTNSITPTSTPFYVRVIVDDRISNSLLVVPTGSNNQCKYEIIQKIIAQWNNSQNSPFVQVQAIIKNTGIKPISYFSFKMDNIDQIWSVDKEGNNYSLPWHPAINPFEQYIFSYTFGGSVEAEIKEPTFVC